MEGVGEIDALREAGGEDVSEYAALLPTAGWHTPLSVKIGWHGDCMLDTLGSCALHSRAEHGPFIVDALVSPLQPPFPPKPLSIFALSVLLISGFTPENDPTSTNTPSSSCL